MGGIINK